MLLIYRLFTEHTYIHTHTHTYIHTYIHTYTHTYIHTHIHTYIHTHTHTYIHTYIHTYMCTHTCMLQVYGLFSTECARFKDVIHLNSFIYDFHLRFLRELLKGTKSFPEHLDLRVFLDTFLQYFQNVPSYIRNRLCKGTVHVHTYVLCVRMYVWACVCCVQVCVSTCTVCVGMCVLCVGACV